MNEWIQYLTLSSGCIDEHNLLWFCPLKFNSLFSCNLDTGDLLWRGCIPGEALLIKSLYRNCVKCGQKIFLVPFNATDIAVYDITKQEFHKIKTDNLGVRIERYTCASAYDNKVFIFGDKTPTILIIDSDSYEVNYFNKINAKLDDIKCNNFGYFSRRMVVENNYCYTIGTKANALITFDMLSLDFNTVYLGDSEGTYVNLIKEGNLIFLIPGMHNKFSIYDLTERKLIESGEEISQPGQFFTGYSLNGQVYVLPCFGEYIVGFSMKNGDISIIKNDISEYIDKKFVGDSSNIHRLEKFTFAYDDNEKAVFFSTMNRKLYIIDKKSGKTKQSSLYLDSKTRSIVYEKFREINNMNGQSILYKENMFFDSGVFVARIAHMD